MIQSEENYTLDIKQIFTYSPFHPLLQGATHSPGNCGLLLLSARARTASSLRPKPSLTSWAASPRLMTGRPPGPRQYCWNLAMNKAVSNMLLELLIL